MAARRAARRSAHGERPTDATSLRPARGTEKIHRAGGALVHSTPMIFRFRVEPSGCASTYSRSVLGASAKLRARGDPVKAATHRNDAVCAFRVAARCGGVSDSRQIRLAIVGASRRMRQLPVAQPPRIDACWPSLTCPGQNLHAGGHWRDFSKGIHGLDPRSRRWGQHEDGISARISPASQVTRFPAAARPMNWVHTGSKLLRVAVRLEASRTPCEEARRVRGSDLLCSSGEPLPLSSSPPRTRPGWSRRASPALDEGSRRSVLRHAPAGVNQGPDLGQRRRSVSTSTTCAPGRDGGSTRLPNPPLPGSARRPRGAVALRVRPAHVGIVTPDL